MNTRPLYSLLSRILPWMMLAGAVIFSARVVWTDAEYLRQPGWIDDDARAQLLPVIAHHHPSAFQDRLVSGYGDLYLPPGYRWLMRGLTTRVDGVTATKGLGLALQLLTLGVALAAGCRAGGTPGGAFTLALTARSIPFHDHVYAGLFRSFAFVLVLLFLWALSERRFRLAGVVLILQALFYPPVCLISLPVFGLTGLRGCRPLRGFPWRSWRWLPLVEAGLFCVAALGIIALYSRKPEELGQAMSLRQADAYDEWFQGGRFSELPFPGVASELRRTLASGVDVVDRGRVWVPGIVPDPNLRANLLVLALAVLAVVILFTRPPGGAVLAGFSFSGVALFLLSRQLAFQLGFPDRFVAYSLPFVAVLLWAVAWRGATERRALRAVVALSGLVIAFAPSWREPNTQRKVIDVTPRLDLYREIARTEPGSLITAWPPAILDEIPVFAIRETLVDLENAHPIYPGYYARIRERMLHSLELAFTNDPGRAAWIRDHHGLTHLVVNHSLYDPSRGYPVVFNPYSQLGHRVRDRALRDPRPPLFHNPPPAWVFARTGTHTVIDLRAIDTPATPPPTPGTPPESWIRWGNDLGLTRIEVLSSEPVQGGTLNLRYHWNVPPHMLGRNNIFFVHFLHDGKMIFAGDHPLFTSLAHADKPAELFHPVDVTYDLALRIPESAPPGEYSVRVGLLYRYPSLLRHRIEPDEPAGPLNRKAWTTPLQIHIQAKP